MIKIFKLSENSIVITETRWDLYITKDIDNYYTLRYYNFHSKENLMNSHNTDGIIYNDFNQSLYCYIDTFFKQLNNGNTNSINIYSDDKATFDLDKANVMKLVKYERNYTGKTYYINMDKNNELFIDNNRRINNKGYLGDYDKKQLIAIEELYKKLKKIAKPKPNDIDFLDFEAKYEIDEYEKMYQRSNYGKQDEKKDQFFHQLRLIKRNIKK